MIKVDNNELDIFLLKVTFTFDKRWYEKYDIFKYKDIEYICISRPKENEDNTWSIDVMPFDGESKLNPNTEFIKNSVSELYQ